MPDSEFMNEKQAAYFRLKLVGLKQGILENASQTTDHLRDDAVVVPDPADRASIEEEHALVLRTRDRERKPLEKAEQSILRIDRRLRLLRRDRRPDRRRAPAGTAHGDLVPGSATAA